jgi:basic membrane lipoprotein Med (substrate-binding protein (PBP1-ABC) superfamily)
MSRVMLFVRTRPWVTFLFLGVVVAALVTWLIMPETEAPRARVYQDVDVCLLTDGSGLAGPAAAAAWAGLRDVSDHTHARISSLAVRGDDPNGAVIAASTLATRHCTVIVAAGAKQAEAADSIAAQYPAVHFVLIGTGRDDVANVVTVDVSGGDLRSAIVSAVEPLVPEFKG